MLPSLHVFVLCVPLGMEWTCLFIVCLFQVLECMCVNNWWLSGVPGQQRYIILLPPLYNRGCFPSEADSLMIRDMGLWAPRSEEKWPGRISEPADPLTRLSSYIAEMLNSALHFLLLLTVIATDSEATERSDVLTKQSLQQKMPVSARAFLKNCDSCYEIFGHFVVTVAGTSESWIRLLHFSPLYLIKISGNW